MIEELYHTDLLLDLNDEAVREMHSILEGW